MRYRTSRLLHSPSSFWLTLGLLAGQVFNLQGDDAGDRRQ